MRIDVEALSIAVKFMERAQLSGSEVALYARAHNEIDRLIEQASPKPRKKRVLDKEE